jgi:hypothetical protein
MSCSPLYGLGQDIDAVPGVRVEQEVLLSLSRELDVVRERAIRGEIAQRGETCQSATGCIAHEYSVGDRGCHEAEADGEAEVGVWANWAAINEIERSLTGAESIAP